MCGRQYWLRMYSNYNIEYKVKAIDRWADELPLHKRNIFRLANATMPFIQFNISMLFKFYLHNKSNSYRIFYDYLLIDKMYPHPVRLPMHIISVQSARHMRMHAFSIRNRVYTFWMDVDNCTFFQLMKHAQTSSVYQYKYKRLTHKPPTNYYMHRARYTRLEQRFNFSLILYAVRVCVCVWLWRLE